MQTHFTPDQLHDPAIAVADGILRKCVHCGFCTATCPTYVVLGDENDSPRGRIYLIKDMLESAKPASAAVTLHVDRCLSCLSCMTTCPSGVHYMHLVDLARVRIEETARRPWHDRLLRRLLRALLPYPRRFAAAMAMGRLGRPFAALLPARLRAMVEAAPAARPTAPLKPQVFAAEGPLRKRVALLAGCVQQVAAAEINAATIRLLTRHGCEVVVAAGSGCCGAVDHHLGGEAAALDFAKANVDAWIAEQRAHGLDAVVINASGCGTVVKDYGFLLRHEAAWAARAAEIAAMAVDVSELLADLPLKPNGAAGGLVVAYHAACSLQHGQRVRDLPKDLLRAAGFRVVEPTESHLCCGSAGTYSILQPELSRTLRDRKTGHLRDTGAQVVASGNVGCILHLSGDSSLPVVHTVELLDWATGGPRPKRL